jgi:sugar O-acyltransferase (sialic acid O-acetyltransferase NeuD family)
MKKVIIFGCKDLAQLSKFYIENDPKYLNEYSVVAFCVSKDHKNLDIFENIPVYEFENIEKYFSPEEFLFFVPMTGVSMNSIRQKIYDEVKKKGYKLFSYVSSYCTNFAKNIGENCFILEDNTIQPFVEIGNNVVMWSGNHIGHHSVVKDNVFFTSHVVLSGHCFVGENSWIGVNSTIRDSVNIMPKTLIGMGSLVTRDTKENGFYLGSPAKIQEKKSYEVL